MRRSSGKILAFILAGSLIFIPSPGETQITGYTTQYAAKVTCGPMQHLHSGNAFQPGDYTTAVNLHNPGAAATKFHYKFASAGIAQDGTISQFVDSSIGADAVQVFDCAIFSSLAKTTGPIDGFFVVETNQDLDVVSYYTMSSATKSVALAVNTVPARTIGAGPVTPPGPVCQKNISIDLGDPTNWTANSSGAKPVAVSTVSASWDPSYKWLSYASDGFIGTGVFEFKLDACSCATGGNLGASVRADNTANGGFLGWYPYYISVFQINSTGQTPPTPAFSALPPSVNPSGNYSSSSPPVTMVSFIGIVGDLSLVIRVNNSGGAGGIGFKNGHLFLENGHLGKCAP